MREKGYIVRVPENKNYAFIRGLKTNKDYFFHRGEFMGFDDLYNAYERVKVLGQKLEVEFTPEESAKGLRAINVILLSDDPLA